MENKTSQAFDTPALQIMDAVNAGYSFVLKPSADLLKIFLTMTVVNALLMYLESLGLMYVTSPGLKVIIQTSLLSALVMLPLVVFLNQKVVTGHGNANYLSYFGGLTLWKTFLITFSISIVFSEAIIFWLFMTKLSVLIHYFVSVVLIILGALLLVYSVTRLAFFIPHIVVHNTVALDAPLQLTKGTNTLRVFGVIFLTTLPVILTLVFLITFGMYEIPHMMEGVAHAIIQLPTASSPLTNALEGMQAPVRQDSSIIVGLLGKGLVSTVLSYFGLIAPAALAHGYKALTQKN